MAETTKIVIETEVTGTAKVAQSLADLKKELKSAQSAALNGDGVAAKRVAELKDKMDDLKDATKSLQGTGIEKGNQALKNFGEGFRNFDFDKIKLGFAGIGSAMKAIPIFLVAEGIAKLIENWDEWGKGNGIVAQAIQYVNGLLDKAKEGLDFLTDSLGFTNSELEKFGDTIKDSADKTKEALNETTAEFDRQIRVAKANGKETVELEIAKQEAIVQTNVVIAKQIEAFVRAGGALDDEKRKLLTASLDAIKNAKVTELEIEQTHTKKVNDEYIKRRDDKKKQEEDSKKESDALFEQLSKEQDVQLQKELDAKKKQEEERAKLLSQMRDQEIALEKQKNAELVAGWDAEDQKKKELHDQEIARQNQALENARNGIIATQGLSDLVFSIKSANLKKGSAEEERVARQQFNINKALQLGTAAVNGAQSILAITSVPDFTLGVNTALRIAAQVALTAGTIAKIASTQFQSSGSASASSSAPSIPTLSGGGNNSAPSTNTSAPTIQPFTRLDERGNVVGNNQPVIKAVVVESDITNSQKRVGRLEGQATFG